MQQDYLDFELTIELLPSGKLRITVVNSPVGSVANEIANPFSAEDISRILAVLDGSSRTTRGEAARAARAFGEKLFGAVFSGQIYAAYLASLNQVGEKAGLRIKLGLENANELTDLPWELLRDPNGDYLVLSRKTPVLRYPRLLTVRPLVEVVLPLRVLVLISSPKDQDALDVEAEWRGLLEATNELRARGLLELERVDNAQLVTLQRKLRAGTNYQIFHYIGHAAFDEKAQSGVLAFEDPRTENTVVVSGESLARELSEENSIRLVLLNACQGARQNRQDPYAGVASSIVARGVPAVVAMQFEISDSASRYFSAEFYKALSEGYPIEAAMAEARRAIGSNLNNLEWATPVLWLRVPSGILFPKRQSVVSATGGLRDKLLTPQMGLIIALMLAVAILLFNAVSGGQPVAQITPTAIVSTLTPTPVSAPRNVDLVVSSLRFLPPNPAPGQPTTISIRIENKGSTDTGRFQWAWFATNPQQNPEPTLTGVIENLSPGVSISVTATWRFSWWGTYTTTAWVNFDNAIPEKSIFNNVLARTVNSSLDDFEVDFTRLPNGDVLEPGTLNGSEFVPWGFTLNADPNVDPNANCANAVTKLQLNANDTVRVITGRSDNTAGCTGLPLVFGLTTPPDGPLLGGVGINFVPNTVGTYALELYALNGGLLNRATVEVDASMIGLTLFVGANAEQGTFNRMAFLPPTNAVTQIERFYRSLPR
jgi:CHAT domain/CARDB